MKVSWQSKQNYIGYKESRHFAVESQIRVSRNNMCNQL